MEWRKASGLVAVVLALGFAGYFVDQGMHPMSSTARASSVNLGAGGALKVGEMAPDFQLTNTQGQTVSLDQLRGKPVWLNFWATWCTWCQKELPDVEAMQKQYGSQVDIVGVDIQESAPTVAKFMAAHGMNYPVLLDQSASVAATYGVQGLPTSIFIGPGGHILAIKVGAFTSTTGMQPYVNQMLQAAKSAT